MAERKSYREQLQDPRWQKRRLEIFEARGWRCESCGEETRQLHVHHGYYEKNKAPWEYDDSTLHVLCDGCHGIAEEHLLAIRRLVGRVRPIRYPELRAQVGAALVVLTTMPEELDARLLPLPPTQYREATEEECAVAEKRKAELRKQLEQIEAGSNDKSREDAA